MSTPGSNILLDALDLIESQTIVYYANTGRTLNAKGVYIASLAAGTTFGPNSNPYTPCSVQPVPRNRYQNLGLDYQKTYVTLYVPANILDLQRDTSGDQFDFNGSRYQVESNTDWFSQDGWDAVMAVRIGNAG